LGNKALEEEDNGGPNDDATMVVAAWADGDSELLESTTYYLSLSSGGRFVSASDGDGDVTTSWGGDSDADGYVDIVTGDFADDSDIAANDIDVTIESAGGVSREVTVTVFYFSGTGVRTAVESHTLTFGGGVTDNATDFGNAKTMVGLTATEANCDEPDNNAAAAAIADSIAYDVTDNSDAFFLCVQLYTEDGGTLPAAQEANVTISVTDSSGFLNVGNDGSSYEDTFNDIEADAAGVSAELDADDGDLSIKLESEDTDVEPFDGTLTVEITHEDDDLGIDVSETYTFDVAGAGTFVELTLEVVQLSTDDDAVAVDVIEYTGTDANGNTVAVDAAAAAADLIIDSDASSSQTIDAVGEEDAEATLANQADATASAAGDIRLTCSDGDFEAIEVTLEVTNADLDDITSNTVTVYCAEATVDSMTISVDDSTPAPGEEVEVTAVALDANGYPVPDAEVITFSAAQGAWTDTTIAHELGEAVGTYVAGQGGTVILIATGDDVVVSTSVMVGNDIALTRSASKLKGTAVLGATYANVRVTFVIERISNGAVYTYYRKADASGVATFTLKKTGRFEVTASYGDSISNTVILKK
jgi:hypothetical protein